MPMRRPIETPVRPPGSDGPAVAPPAEATPETADEERLAEGPAPSVDPRKQGRWRRWRALALLLALAVGIMLLVRWWNAQPVPVTVVRPEPRAIVETVASSGQVGGKRETAVGASVQGVVAQLYVDEGSFVRQGAVLARIRNDVATAQLRQAEQAVRTARAQLAQAAAGPRASELAAARAQVQQAEATVRQRAAAVDQSRAQVRQAEARLELARKTLERYRYLLGEGAIARQMVDQAVADERAASAELAAAREGVATAQATLSASRAAIAASQAELRTLAAGPRQEAVAVARQRVRETEAALRVARAQAGDAVVRAPFTGTVTRIIAQLGAPVGPEGVVRMVQTTRPEIRVDVDESSLADIRVGQRAVITSSTYRNARLEGRVTEVGAAVDPARGTVEITVVLDTAPDWLRPGQTVNVNIITAEGRSRLVVPRSAVRREGGQPGAEPVYGRSEVLLVRDGRAVARPVVLGPVEGDSVPVLEGLSPHDRVIRDAGRVQPGARVRVTGGG
jgi:HlyD family secretion protein